MDKLKYIKLELADGSYTNSIPIAVDADQVSTSGESNLATDLVQINNTNSAQQTQINNLQSEVSDIDKKAAKTDLDAIYTSLDNKVEYQSHVDTEADLPLIVDWDAVDKETPELVLDIQDNFNEIKINRNNVFSRGGKIKNILNSINKAWIPNDMGEDYRYWLGTSYSLSDGSNLWGLYVFNNYKRSSGGKQSTSVFLGKVTAPNNTEVALPFYYISATAKKHKKVRFYNLTQSDVYDDTELRGDISDLENAWKIVHADGSIENVTVTSAWTDRELTTNSLIFPDLANSGATALNYVDFMKFNLGSSSSTGYKSEGYYAIGSPQSSLSFYQWDHSTLNNFRLAVEEVYPGIVGYNALHLEEFDDTYEGELYHYTIADTPLLIINTDNRMEYGFLNAGIKTGNLYSVGADNELFYIDPTYKYQHWAQGGGGGTSDYTALSNKPQINGTTLTGNKTGSDLGLVSSADVLTKTNTTSYTPSGDYQPATKKYVDDSVGGVFVPTKTSQLTNDSNFIGKNSNDLTYYYTKTQTDTLFDELGVKVGTSVDNNYRVNVLHSSNLWHYNTTKTTNGVTSTYENSTITLNGTAIGTGYNVPTDLAMLHLNAGNYALKLTEISGTKPGGQLLIIRNVTSGTNLVDTDFSTTNTYTFTLSSNADIAVRVYFWNNNVFINYKFGVQLQEGSKTDAYEPYVTPSINVDGEEIYSKNMMATLESLKPYILYESSSGVSTGSITLSETSADFSYMEIYFKSTQFYPNENYQCTKVFSPNGKYVNLNDFWISGNIEFHFAQVYINGTTISRVENHNMFMDGSTFNHTTNAALSIVKVVGYK